MLVDPALSGLPAFLTPRPGLNSGFMIPQVTAAALVSENKQRAYPASVDSIPTSANQEDHVSMAAHGAPAAAGDGRRIWRSVIGIELLAAAQGCDFHAPLTSCGALERGAGGAARRGADAGRGPAFPSRHGGGDRAGASGALVDGGGLDLPGVWRERLARTSTRGDAPLILSLSA